MCAVLWNEAIVSYSKLFVELLVNYLNHFVSKYFLCSGFVERDKIVSFVDNRTKFVRKGKGVDFRRAVEQMDEYVLDSVVRIQIITLNICNGN